MSKNAKSIVAAWAGCLVACLCVLPSTARCEVKMSGYFTDHMVLERDMAVPIFGQAAPDEKVTVEFNGQQKTATAGPDGKWLVKLDPLTAGGPSQLVIRGSNTITINDVLVGEVWVGSGQSNMQKMVAIYIAPGENHDEMVTKLAKESYPRVRIVKRGVNPVWQECNPHNLGDFSVLLFVFGHKLQEELDVPVGLMMGAVGGTPSANWLSPEALAGDAACQDVIRKFAAANPTSKLMKEYEQKVADWEKGAKAAEKEGKKPQFPRPNPPVKPGECSEGKVGEHYDTYIRPMMPYGIRGVLWDQGEAGTAILGLDQFTLMGALVRGWRKDWGQGDFPFICVQKRSGDGCAWDMNDPVTMKAEPFVPLPAKVPEFWEGRDRGNYNHILEHPNTALAQTSDLGGGNHPVNKYGYGTRAARTALGFVYGKPIQIYGPIYDSHAVEGNKIRVCFTQVGKGLAFKYGDKIQGFMVAGENKVFHWANAVIDGDTVVVSCPQVAKPVAVRYAWAKQIGWANLFNKDGLPALTFRTDDW